ncbi:MAG TPA: hypothetical protein VG347_17240 [Verrucomicrobiae bacterium]|nr:hypothetical protein [Verrucomicrobiae bacterium]
MKLKLCLPVVLSTIIAATTCTSQATVFFSDSFTNGSTLNSASPANPTPTNTAYEMASSKAWNPTPTLTANDLKMGIAATTSGYFQAAALFATNQIALTQPGDFIELTVVFTNTSGLLTAAGQVGFGLYNSGQVKPIAGGINNTIGNSYSGGAQNWQGYVGSVNFTGASSRINTRPAQTATTGLNQDLLSFGTSSSYANPQGIGTATGSAALTVGGVYTDVLYMQLNAASGLAITNSIYSGVGTGGSLITSFGGVTNASASLVSGFDGLAIGYTGRASTGGAPTIEVASVKVDGSVTTITGPPTINTQPVDVAVAAGGSCPFNVSATGFGVTYQWRRHGTNLLNAGNISGANTSMLIITNASAADALSGANGYYCVVSGAGGFSVNTTTQALTIVTAKNLVWDGTGTVWDLNNSPSWATGQTFNYGDAVTFDDSGTGGGGNVTLSGNYLSASTWTVTGGASYAFSGTGSFAGTGTLIYTSTGFSQFNVANTHTGGTIINSPTTVTLYQYQSLGNGPVTLAGGGEIEISPTPSGSATTGINGDVNVTDDYTIQFDTTGSFAGVFLGNLAGTTGKTLTLKPSNTSGANRYRVYGANTVDNGNINLFDSSVLLAPYQGSGTQTYNGIISGPGAMMHKGTVTYFNNANTYSGGMNLSTGTVGLGIDSAGGTDTSVTSGPIGKGPLLLTIDSTTASTGSGEILASGGARTLGNSIQFPTGTNNLTLIIGGTNTMTLSGTFTLNGNDSVTTNTITARTIQVTNTAGTIISGVISDTSLGYGLIKSGTGALYLNNAANAFSGPTTNTAGLLAGTGVIPTSLVVTTNASIGGGSAASMGTLTINGNLSLVNGGGFFRVNRSGSASDKVSVSGTLSSSGALGVINVTNLGSTLQVGDSFTLFNKAVTGGATLNVIGGGVAWGNNLAVNGSIVVVNPPDTGVQLSAPASVALGANITNTITVTNIGPGTAYSVVVTDTLPANVSFVSATSGGTTNGNTGVVVWSGISLAANTSSNLTLVVNAPTVGTVTNIATVASSSIDTVPANNAATNLIAVTSVIIPTVPPHVSTFSLVGANVVITGTNGVTGGTYYLLGATNLLTPRVQWTPLATNLVSTNGANNAFNFTGTNVVVPGAGKQFYILSSTNNR